MQLDGLNILLAEDNATNRLVAVQMLESMGASVAVARDGAEALDLLHRAPFDVLLIDIEMPKLSGLEVIRRLAAEAPRDGLAVVALTAYAAPRQRDEIVAAGAAGVITKPIMSFEQFSADILGFVRARPRAGAPGAGAAEIDLDAYRDLTVAVGPEALAEFLGKVDADISAAYDRAQEAISGSDMAELRAATHILVAVAGAVGAVALQRTAEELNRAARAPGGAALASLGPALAAETGRVRAFLRRERHG